MEPDQKYRVIRLLVENYKRLKAADVTPPRHAVVVAGKNAAGKTSLLDSIAAALGGKKQMATQPLRAGTESGQIVCILGEDNQQQLLVKRVFDAEGKTALEITSAEGYKAPSPQAILDSLCSSIAFDPLAFTRMSPREQLETLRELVGLDFSEMDSHRKAIYDKRTEINKEQKRLLAQAQGMTFPADTPLLPVDVAKLMEEQRRRMAVNKANESERARVKELEHQVKRLAEEHERIEAEIIALTKRREDVWARCQDAEANRSAQESKVAKLTDANVEEIQQQIVDVQSINANVQKRLQQQELLGGAEEKKNEAEALTDKLEAIDAEKEKQLASVKWPIEGLTFGEEGPMYKGVPFDQASGAEQLAVSFAMSAALNPRLKVAIVRDASLLDEDQMAAVCDLAAKYDTQVWLEVVDTEAGPAGILIEDGTVVAGGTPADAPEVTKPKRQRKTKAKPEPEPADTVAQAEIDDNVNARLFGDDPFGDINADLQEDEPDGFML